MSSLLMDIWLSFFVITNNGTVNNLAYTAVYINVHITEGEIPRNEILRSKSHVFVIFIVIAKFPELTNCTPTIN